jgi:hypothetical protein
MSFLSIASAELGSLAFVGDSPFPCPELAGQGPVPLTDVEIELIGGGGEPLTAGLAGLAGVALGATIGWLLAD